MTTSVKTTKVYDEIIDFIAAGTTSQSVIDFKLSATAQDRLEDLVYRHKTGELTPEEKRELNHFLTLEHIMTLAKARAYTYIKRTLKKLNNYSKCLVLTLVKNCGV